MNMTRAFRGSRNTRKALVVFVIFRYLAHCILTPCANLPFIADLAEVRNPNKQILFIEMILCCLLNKSLYLYLGNKKEQHYEDK